MVYAAQFHRLVVGGKLYADRFNFSLSIANGSHPDVDDAPAVTQVLLDAVGAVINTAWTSGGADGLKITADAKLDSVKLNRIGPDGKYVDGVTMEKIYADVPGTVTNANGRWPAQLATAVTLRTNVERGHASKGRFYLPPNGTLVSMGADGRALISTTTELATAAKTLMIELDEAYSGTSGFEDMRVCVASNIGTGTFRTVRAVSVGRVPDTIRSRRSKLAEEPIEVPLQ